jgi:hypothetical protein
MQIKLDFEDKVEYTIYVKRDILCPSRPYPILTHQWRNFPRFTLPCTLTVTQSDRKELAFFSASQKETL